MSKERVNSVMSKLQNCLISPKMHNPEAAPRQGLIMVKPHSTKQGLDHVVESILRADGNFQIEGLADLALKEAIKSVEVNSVIVRDLSAVAYGPKLLKHFYGDKINRRYYPIILELYLGRVVFLSFTLNPAGSKDAANVFDDLKGTTQTFDSNGDIVDTSKGIRGIFGEPYVVYSNQELAEMDEERFRRAIIPAIQNYIHVCDKPNEAETALIAIS